MLQIETNAPQAGWRPFVLLLYGMPKVGKTTMAASFHPSGSKGSLIIDTEDGSDEVACNRIKVKTLEELSQALNLAYKSEFGTIAVDTLDRIYHWTELETVKSLNAKYNTRHTAVEEFSYGLGTAVARNQLLAFINKLSVFKSVGKCVLLISHQRQATIETESEKSRTVDLPGKLSRMIAASVDAIGLVYVKMNNNGRLHRYISFKPYGQVDAGCRLRELAGKDLPFTFNAIHDALVNGKEGDTDEQRTQEPDLVGAGLQVSGGNGHSGRKSGRAHS